MIKKILLFLFIGLSIFGIYEAFSYYKWKKLKDYRNSFYENLVDTSSPTVSTLRDSISIPYQNQKRTIHIYVPPSYAKDSMTRYPVIYMLDGEQCFDELAAQGPEWQFDEVINQADSSGDQTAIVIAIEQDDPRDPEYTPWPIEEYPNAHGAQFSKWLSYELKPWVDEHYRTEKAPTSNIIGGISRSGMMAYYILMAHPEIWGNALIQSPSMWIDYDRLMAMELPRKDLAEKRFFISVGDQEGEMVDLAEDLFKKFNSYGLGDDQLKLQYIKGEGHWHMTWRKSFALAYPWLMNNKN